MDNCPCRGHMRLQQCHRPRFSHRHHQQQLLWFVDRTQCRVAPVWFSSIVVSGWNGFCVSAQFDRKGRFRFWLRFLTYGSGGSSSAFDWTVRGASSKSIFVLKVFSRFRLRLFETSSRKTLKIYFIPFELLELHFPLFFFFEKQFV